VATFDGSNIFGAAVSMATGDVERESQVNSFFGVSGTEVLDGGQRGTQTIATGVLAGVDQSAFNSAVALVRSYKDGAAYTLVDTAGVTWANVRLAAFNLKPPRRQASNGVVFQPYQIVFEHL